MKPLALLLLCLAAFSQDAAKAPTVESLQKELAQRDAQIRTLELQLQQATGRANATEKMFACYQNLVAVDAAAVKQAK